mgnify:CR=1 FL=1
MKDIVISIILSFMILLSSTIIEVTPTIMNSSEIEKKINIYNKDSKDEGIKQLLIDEYNENKMYDIAGVIYIEDIAFDVVMMPTESDEYLHASRNGEYLREGELFLSDLSNFNETRSLDMTRIYGHNMATGRKFGLISRLHNKENARPMYFYDGVKVKKYTIARTFKFIDGTETFERYGLTDEEKQSFLSKITENYVSSHIEEFDPSKEVVFLQTCQTATGLMRDVVVYVEEGVIWWASQRDFLYLSWL